MRRLVLFVVCLALGCTVGLVGWLMSGSQWWYLAIPGAMAAGWLMVANPEQCMPREEHGAGGGAD
jgi:hypothetical protein